MEAGEIDKLVAPGEAAALLGVKPRSFHQWRHRKDATGIPDPDSHFGPTPVWKFRTLLRWAGRTGHIRSAESLALYREVFGEEPVAPRAGGKLPSGKPSGRRSRKGAFDPKSSF